MTLDGFLTFLTLAVAIYALVPPVTKLGAGLALGPQLLLALLAVCLVLYFQFYDALVQPCPRVMGTACRFLVLPPKFNPQQVSFLVVLVWGLLAAGLFKISKPQASSLPQMQRVVDDLMHERSYAEVLKLTRPHLQLIDNAANRRLWLQRWHDFFAGSRPGTIGALARRVNRLEREPPPTGREKFIEYARARTWWMYKVIPSGDVANEAGDNILQALCGSDDLIDFMASMRPYAAIPILALRAYKRVELSDQYMRKLCNNSKSIFYSELRNNQNKDGRAGYWHDPRNKLLYFLFKNAKNAHDLEIYRPVGDQALQALDPNRNQEYISNLNNLPGDFPDNEEWRDITFCSEVFFDIMINSAARQDIEWHMWLYYLRDIINRLIEIYDETGPAIDVDDEWPNRTAFLLYRAMKMLVEWASLVDHLPTNSVHLNFLGGEVAADNANIPASAVNAFSQCIGNFVMAENIGESFKVYLHQSLMRDLHNLRRDGAPGLIRAALIQALASGGRRPAFGYGDKITGLFAQADHVLKANLDDYEAALRAAHPGSMGLGFAL